MTTFNWTVTQMDCYPEVAGKTDVVFTVHWTCSGSEEGVARGNCNGNNGNGNGNGGGNGNGNGNGNGGGTTPPATETYNASVYSTCSLPLPTGTEYTPYADLTQAQVLGWIWGAGVDKTATEAAVQKQLDNQINPPVVAPPLPWM